MNKKNQVIHQLIINLTFSGINLPEKLQACIENIQFSTGQKRLLLIQQAIGYVVAMRDFDLLESHICDAIINALHDAR